MLICLKCKRDGKIVTRLEVELNDGRRRNQHRLGKRLLNLLEVIGPPYSSVDVSLTKEKDEKLQVPKRQAD